MSWFRSSAYRRYLLLWGYLFLVPALFLYLLVDLYPLLWAFQLSLQRYSIFAPPEFVGLENYHRMLQDPLFWKSLRNTLIWTTVVVPCIILISLPLAILLDAPWLRFKTFFRTVYFLPVVTSMVAAAFVWRWLFEPTFGVVNFLLGLLGLPRPGWLSDPAWALPAVMVVGVWKQIGQAMVLFLAGLQTIPREYVEAAKIDGASTWQLFRYVTLPLLNPTLVFVSVILVINAFRVFTIPYVMSSGGLQFRAPGGPLDATRVYVLHIYDLGFRQFDLGYASANAMVLLLMVVLVTLVQMRFLEKRI